MVLAQDIIDFEISELSLHVVQFLFFGFLFTHDPVKPLLADLRFESLVARINEVLPQNVPGKLPLLIQFHFVYVPNARHRPSVVVQQFVDILQRCGLVELKLFLLLLKQLVFDAVQLHLISFRDASTEVLILFEQREQLWVYFADLSLHFEFGSRKTYLEREPPPVTQ